MRLEPLVGDFGDLIPVPLPQKFADQGLRAAPRRSERPPRARAVFRQPVQNVGQACPPELSSFKLQRNRGQQWFERKHDGRPDVHDACQDRSPRSTGAPDPTVGRRTTVFRHRANILTGTSGSLAPSPSRTSRTMTHSTRMTFAIFLGVLPLLLAIFAGMWSADEKTWAWNLATVMFGSSAGFLPGYILGRRAQRKDRSLGAKLDAQMHALTRPMPSGVLAGVVVGSAVLACVALCVGLAFLVTRPG